MGVASGRLSSFSVLPDLIPSFGTKLSMIFAKERGTSMSRSRHTEAQMIGALKRVEAGRAVEDVAREVGVSKHTIYGWKAKHGGMDVSQAQEAKQLRDENMRLRKLVADLSLDKEALQSDSKKRLELVALKAAIGQMRSAASPAPAPPAASARVHPNAGSHSGNSTLPTSSGGRFMNWRAAYCC